MEGIKMESSNGITENNLPLKSAAEQEHFMFIDLLDQCQKKFYEEMKYCQKDLGEESVHDARVAARRLIALLNLLLPAAVSNPDPESMRELNRIIRLSGGLRDWDAQINYTFNLLPSNSELKDFYSSLVIHRYQAAQRLKQRLKTIDPDDIKKTVRFIHKQFVILFQDPSGYDKIKTNILQTIDQELLTVLEAADKIDPDKPNTIHRLRLALKNYRYSVEVMNPILTITEPEYEALQAYQTMLGDIQDLEVLGSSLDQYISKDNRIDRDQLVPVRRLLAGQKEALINKLRHEKLEKHLTR
jgi:CHAD domain-containing protein